MTVCCRYVWSVAKGMKKTPVKFAHKHGVTCVGWTGDDTLITGGADACLRTWKVQLPG